MIEEVAGAAKDLIKAGRVRHFGMSEPAAGTIRLQRPAAQAIDAGHARSDPRPRTFTAFGVIEGQSDMALLGRVQRRDLPGQVVVPRPGAELVNADRHNYLKGKRVNLAVTQVRVHTGDASGVYGTSDFEIGEGYAKTSGSAITAQLVDGLGL